MTTAFATLLIGVAGAALVLALAAYWWVNRTPSTDERFDEHGRLPLFGVDLTASASAAARRPVAAASEPDAEDELTERSEVTAGAQSASDAAAPEAIQRYARPVGDPILIDTSAIEAANGAPPLPAPSDTKAPAANSTSAAGNRLRSAGWGEGPGWPVQSEPAVTPRFVPPVRDGHRHTPPAPPAVRETPANGNGVYADGVPGSMVEGHAIRFSTPMEGTLQFLPGRLEISSGLDTGREIRFVRVPGPNGTQVTFGRNEGPLYRHIQLRDQTVSREHARMTLVDGRWLLTNLSTTNPVAHNGRELSPGEHQALEDGDRLDMGEVVFSFRSR